MIKEVDFKCSGRLFDVTCPLSNSCQRHLAVDKAVQDYVPALFDGVKCELYLADASEGK